MNPQGHKELADLCVVSVPPILFRYRTVRSRARPLRLAHDRGHLPQTQSDAPRVASWNSRSTSGGLRPRPSSSTAGSEGLRSTWIQDSLLNVAPGSRLLQKLRQWGWTEMSPGADDARQIFHRITPSGRAKLAELESTMDEAHEAIQRELGDGKVAEVVSLCQDVIKASQRLRVRSAVKRDPNARDRGL